MENNEKKINAVELNDEKLEKVSGGVDQHDSEYIAQNEILMEQCDVCGEENANLHRYRNRFYCPACKEKAGF